MARAGARRREQRHHRGHAAGRYVQGLELGVRRRSLPARLSVRRAGTSLRLRPAARCRRGRRNAPALPLPAQCHDSDPAHHQRLWLSRTACAVSAPAADGAHRLHRRLDHGRQSLLPVLVPGIHRQLAQPVVQPAQARRQVRGAECRPREHHLERQRQHRARGGAAAETRPPRLLRGRQPVPARQHGAGPAVRVG